MTTRYDCVVIGGGPAGATAARNLALHGWRVLVVDKASFPRDKPCGALCIDLFADFPYLSPFREELVLAECGGIWINIPAIEKKIRWTGDAKYTSRIVLDNRLVKLAKTVGAELQEKATVNQLRYDSNTCEWKIQYKEKTTKVIKAPLVIGADGVLGVTAKLSGLRRRWQPDEVSICQVAEYQIHEELMDALYGKDRCAHTFIGYHGIPGYGWVFPRNNTVNIGLGGCLPRTKWIKSWYFHFINFLQNEGLAPPDEFHRKVKPKSWMIPMCGPRKKKLTDGLFLVGDAAGYTNPLTGEGIRFAMHSGKIAAYVGHSCLQDEKCSKQRIKAYEKICYSKFGRKLRGYKTVKELVLNRHSNWIFQNFLKMPLMKKVAAHLSRTLLI